MCPSDEQVMNILATVQEYARLGLPSDVFKFPKYNREVMSHWQPVGMAMQEYARLG